MRWSIGQPISFICEPCRKDEKQRDAFHEQCKGGTWCDCQHRTDRRKGK